MNSLMIESILAAGGVAAGVSWLLASVVGIPRLWADATAVWVIILGWYPAWSAFSRNRRRREISFFRVLLIGLAADLAFVLLELWRTR